MRALVLLGWCFLLLATGCERPRTQIVVRVVASADTWAMARSFHVHAAREEGGPPIVSRCFDPSANPSDPRPREVGLLPDDADDARPVRVVVQLFASPCVGTNAPAGPELLAQSARVRFEREKTSILTFPFTLACRGVTCADAACGVTTCADDGRGGHECACVARDLPAYGSPGSMSRSDVPDAGACTTGCATCDAGVCASVVEVVAGIEHTCARLSDGTVRCWGANGLGQAAPPTGADLPTPTLVPLADRALELSVGYEHTCARTVSGVWCWGSRYNAQIGPGIDDGEPDATPVRPDLSAITSPIAHIVAGRSNTCAVTQDRRAWCWGRQDDGQLGDGVADSSVRPTPALVGVSATTPLADVDHIALGGGFACAASAGAVRCWGNNNYGQLGDGTSMNRARPTSVAVLSGVDQVVAGRAHVCARVVADKTVRCWGDNNQGQLGDGSGPQRTAPAGALPLRDVEAIASGDAHVCAIVGAERALWCWGYNAHGQLGDGSTTARVRPIRVGALSGVMGVTAGHRHTCAWTRDGVVRCWGRDDMGQLGNGATLQRTPAPVGTLRATDLSVGSTHACAMAMDGTARCWGDNTKGQLSPGSYSELPVANPREVTVQEGGVPMLDLVALAPGDRNTCARLRSNAVRCWSNETDVEGLRGGRLTTGVTAIRASESHACAMVSEALHCWGDNTHGSLGNGTVLPTAAGVAPTAVMLGRGVSDFSVGFEHTCAIRDGSAWCWGANFSAELGGDSQANEVPVPRQVTLLGEFRVIQIGCGRSFTCAALMNGDVRCWGDNTYGQAPTGVIVSSAADLAVGSSHACALVGTRVHCWGLNNFGQLGVGDLSTRSGDVAGLTLPAGVTIRRLAIGGETSCAVLSDGTVRCWGRNTHGLVGNRVPGYTAAPTTVDWR